MFRHDFHNLCLALLIFITASMLAGCYAGKTVSSVTSGPAGVPAQQPIPPAAVQAGAENAQTAGVAVPTSTQILFLRINQRSVNINPFTKIPDLSTATRDIWVMGSEGGNAVNLTEGWCGCRISFLVAGQI